MKYAQTFLVAILLISGTFIWYSFYSSFQEKKEEAAQQPEISSPSPSQEEETGPPPSVDQDREEIVIIPHIHQDGLTQQMVKEWNIEDERISIDQLLSLLEKNKP